jgi:hypothetical protein
VNTDRLYVNQLRTVLVRIYDTGRVEVLLRDEPDAIWSPPIHMIEEPAERTT